MFVLMMWIALLCRVWIDKPLKPAEEKSVGTGSAFDGFYDLIISAATNRTRAWHGQDLNLEAEGITLEFL